MPNYNRANRDPEERIFDGGDDGDENEGSHLPVVIIITILVLAAFGGVVWLAYNQGVARGRGDAPVRIASSEPVKTENGGLKVYQQPAGTDEGDTPKPAATAPATPPPAAPAAQPPVQTPPVQAAPVQSPAPAPVQPAPVSPKPAPKTVTQTYPPPVMAPPAMKPSMTAPKPAPQPAAPQVATKGPAQLGMPQPATLPPKVAAATPPKPVPLKPSDAPKPAAASGSYLLQIGAYKSDSEAQAAWRTYQSKHAALLAGFSSDVQQTTHPDGSVWYRLRIASFADKTAAGALCDRLKSQGGACFVSK
jgi:hypothetical protein